MISARLQGSLALYSRRRVACLLLLLPLRAAAGGDVSLRAPLRIFDVQSPVTVAAGDFDGNGILDIAVVGLSQLNVFLAVSGKRDQWEALPPSRVGMNSFFVRSGDFDHDGRDDLTIGDLAGTAFFLRSKGEGAFEQPIALKEAQEPRWIAHGDFDGDGELDFAGADAHTRRISFFQGHGNGTFSFLRYHELGHDPHSIEALDFDGNGVLDLAVGVPNVGLVSARGEGHARFEFLPADPRFGTSAGIRYLAAGDWDQDGLGDVTASSGVVGSSRGDGTFRVALEAQPGDAVTCPIISDLDGDGVPDLAFMNSGGAHVFRGVSGGPFDARRTLPFTRLYPYFAIGRDLDGDGCADLVIADIDLSVVTVWRGEQTESLLETPLALSSSGDNGAAAAFLPAGTGSASLFLADTKAPRIRLYSDLGPLSSTEPITIDTGNIYDSLATADLNGDGVADLAGTNRRIGSALVALLDSKGGLIREDALPAGNLPAGVEIGRMDGDLSPDLAIPCEGSSEVALFLGRGDGSFAPAKSIPSLEKVAACRLRDLDGDEMTDVAAAGAGVVAVHFGAGGGEASAAVMIHQDETAIFAGVEIVELNGDGLLDVLVFERLRGELVVLQNQGDRRFEPRKPIDDGRKATSFQAADLDGDGRVDVSAAFPAEKSLTLFLNRGGGLLDEAMAYDVRLSPQRHILADVDGDTALDAVVLDAENAEVIFGYRAAGADGHLRRGDASGNGEVEIGDPIVLLGRLFLGAPPLICEDAADADDDGTLALNDVVSLLQWLFLAGDPPAAPGPYSCGEDPLPDGLSPCTIPCEDGGLK